MAVCVCQAFVRRRRLAVTQAVGWLRPKPSPPSHASRVTSHMLCATSPCSPNQSRLPMRWPRSGPKARLQPQHPLDADDRHGNETPHGGGERVLGAHHAAAEKREARRHQHHQGGRAQHPGGAAGVNSARAGLREGGGGQQDSVNALRNLQTPAYRPLFFRRGYGYNRDYVPGGHCNARACRTHAARETSRPVPLGRLAA